MQVQFNTGRKYTANGQRIIATLHDDLTVTFHDLDRMITGEFTLEAGSPALADFFNDKRKAIELVMWKYDRGEYENGGRSWRDGMMSDGCNASSKWGQEEDA